MVFIRLLVLLIFLAFVIIMLNVILPYMFPRYKYWWMFRKDRLNDAHRKLAEAEIDVEAQKLEKKADKLSAKLEKKDESNV